VISTNRQVFVTGLAVAAGTLVTARAEATGADGHAGGTHRSEDIKVVAGHHVTLVKPSDLIQEDVFQVRNFGSTPGFARWYSTNSPGLTLF
jgi:hypothetical protein